MSHQHDNHAHRLLTGKACVICGQVQPEVLNAVTLAIRTPVGLMPLDWACVDRISAWPVGIEIMLEPFNDGSATVIIREVNNLVMHSWSPKRTQLQDAALNLLNDHNLNAADRAAAVVHVAHLINRLGAWEQGQ